MLIFFIKIDKNLQKIIDNYQGNVGEIGKKLKEKRIFLPDGLEIQFYLYFLEPALNMVNYAQELADELACKRINF